MSVNVIRYTYSSTCRHSFRFYWSNSLPTMFFLVTQKNVLILRARVSVTLRLLVQSVTITILTYTTHLSKFQQRPSACPFYWPNYSNDARITLPILNHYSLFICLFLSQYLSFTLRLSVVVWLLCAIDLFFKLITMDHGFQSCI